MRRDEKDIFIECNFILKLSVTCTIPGGGGGGAQEKFG